MAFLITASKCSVSTSAQGTGCIPEQQHLAPATNPPRPARPDMQDDPAEQQTFVNTNINRAQCPHSRQDPCPDSITSAVNSNRTEANAATNHTSKHSGSSSNIIQNLNYDTIDWLFCSDCFNQIRQQGHCSMLPSNRLCKSGRHHCSSSNRKKLCELRRRRA